MRIGLMKEMPPFTGWTLFYLVLVLGCAAGARGWYVAICTANGDRDAALLVQGLSPRSHFPDGKTIRGRTPPTEFDNLAANIAEHEWFGGLPPLSDVEEQTAHVAP